MKVDRATVSPHDATALLMVLLLLSLPPSLPPSIYLVFIIQAGLRLVRALSYVNICTQQRSRHERLSKQQLVKIEQNKHITSHQIRSDQIKVEQGKEESHLSLLWSYRKAMKCFPILLNHG